MKIKQWLVVLMTTLMMLYASALVQATPGDVSPADTPDGKIDVNDAVEILRMVLGIRTDKPAEADVSPLNDPDGIIDVNDAVVILQNVLGIVAVITVDGTSLTSNIPDATNGETLFVSNGCNASSCHGSSPANNRNRILNGKDAANIRTAINNNNGGVMRNFSGLTDEQLEDIAAWLSTF